MTDPVVEPRPMQDGPNTHHYRTFTRGTSFHVITVDYADGDRHTFHVPSEVVNELDRATLDTARDAVPGPSLDEIIRRWFGGLDGDAAMKEIVALRSRATDSALLRAALTTEDSDA